MGISGNSILLVAGPRETVREHEAEKVEPEKAKKKAVESSEARYAKPEKHD
ncbi:hypothetical protein [Natrialba sp. SSL1]|uniref:hypothetical protein n=1 Tax=Natrialba sp. SSL1 TaxID=1869245 RepID=UPI0014960D9D|nr:hypothetical protein [Natrialba sp. SSL1]